MKEFEIPQFEVVHFSSKNIISDSCSCVDCGECPAGSNDCPCYQWPQANSQPAT